MATDKLVDFDHVADYISREAALFAVVDAVQSNDNGFRWGEIVTFTGGDIIKLIKSIPAADVVEVVHGTWEGETDFIYADLSQRVICDKCGAFAYFYDKMPMNFCPNCGADMRKVTP